GDVCRKERGAHRGEEERQVDRMPNVAIRSAVEEGPFFGELAVDVLPGQKRPRGEQWQSDKQKDGAENLESHRERKGERPRLAIEDDARGDPVDRQAHREDGRESELNHIDDRGGPRSVLLRPMRSPLPEPRGSEPAPPRHPPDDGHAPPKAGEQEQQGGGQSRKQTYPRDAESIARPIYTPSNTSCDEQSKPLSVA